MSLTRENYRQYDAINASRLCTLDRNPSKVEEKEDWSDGLAFGDLVDLMCFEPQKVDEEYYVNDADRDPSSTAKDLADYLLDHDDTELRVENGDIITKTTKKGVPTDLNLDEAIDIAKSAVGSSTNFRKYGGVGYLKSQIESQNKKVVSQELYQKARSAMMTLKTHDFTRNYFKDNRSHIEIQFQVPILWSPSYFTSDLDERRAKSLLDIVILDHKNETVLPVDLKTTGSSVFTFESKMTKWRYYIQGTYYYDAMRYRVNHHGVINEYDVLPFEFVVISRQNLNNPLVYTMTEQDLDAGRNGGKLSYNGREVRGWIELMKDLKWHQENNKWNYSREIYENDGKIELDMFES